MRSGKGQKTTLKDSGFSFSFLKLQTAPTRLVRQRKVPRHSFSQPRLAELDQE
jgi:hypothetical protein